MSYANIRIFAVDDYQYANTVMPDHAFVIFEGGRFWSGPDTKHPFSGTTFVVPVGGRLEISAPELDERAGAYAR